jgi:hypothetical protein
MPNDAILTSQSPATLSVVKNQNTTLSVVASANFSSTYTYQWRLSTTANIGTNIPGATNSSYFFEPEVANTGKAYVCVVDSFDGASLVKSLSASTFMTITLETGRFAAHILPDSFNQHKESGQERFRRLRHLGYC